MLYRGIKEIDITLRVTGISIQKVDKKQITILKGPIHNVNQKPMSPRTNFYS